MQTTSSHDIVYVSGIFSGHSGLQSENLIPCGLTLPTFLRKKVKTSRIKVDQCDKCKLEMLADTVHIPVGNTNINSSEIVIKQVQYNLKHPYNKVGDSEKRQIDRSIIPDNKINENICIASIYHYVCTCTLKFMILFYGHGQFGSNIHYRKFEVKRIHSVQIQKPELSESIIIQKKANR
jgi:hypothetical protein